MKKIKFCLMWHQHQPFYKDTLNSIYRMPWTFMHSIKDYYDMLYLALKNDFPVTINLVPILLYQIQDYETSIANDELLKIVLSDSKDLTEAEQKKLFTYAFDSMDPKKIQRNSAYRDLLHARNLGEKISVQDLQDIQTFLLLSWLGEVAFLENDFLLSLREKQGKFTKEDKENILQVCRQIINKIIPSHARAWQEDKIELTTSPFFHPIIPLLESFEAARVSVPDLPLPGMPANMGDDAHLHIERGQKYAQAVLGKNVTGFWPAEGSVSPFAADVYAAHGIQYLMADEGILANSLHMSGVEFTKNSLYSPYIYDSKNGKIGFFFRDTELSDLIGFTYSAWDTENAVNDFIARLRRVSETSNVEEPVVCVMLDGENAWEAYANNGFDFLDMLYRKIRESGFIEPCTYEKIFQSNIEKKSLPNLFSGSWIYSNFNTWIGHPEKNRAWELLVSVKKIYEEKKSTLDSRTLEKAEFELLAAEGSDWFWWYGDDFYSHFSDDFDELFRLHLRNVCDLCGIEAPQNLQASIRKRHRGGIRNLPNGFLKTKIDGKIEGFFDWLGAGEFDLAYDASTMQMGSRRFKILKYGPAYSETSGVYFGLPGNFKNIENEILEIEIMDSEIVKIIWDMKNHKILDVVGKIEREKIKILQDVILEMFIPYEKEESRILVQFRIIKNGQIVEKAPMYSMATLPLTQMIEGDWII